MSTAICLKFSFIQLEYLFVMITSASLYPKKIGARLALRTANAFGI